MLSPSELLDLLSWLEVPTVEVPLRHHDRRVRWSLEKWLPAAEGITDRDKFDLASRLDGAGGRGWRVAVRSPLVARSLVTSALEHTRAAEIRAALEAESVGVVSLRVAGGDFRVIAEDLSDEAIATVLPRISESLSRLHTSVSPGLRLVSLYTHEIVLRAENAPATFGSSSWPDLVGRMSLINAHLGDVTGAMIANAFVHEAIHSLLYVCETSEPLCPDIRETHVIRITSPWSGRALALPSYVHACVVWFGLWMMWRLPSAREAYGEIDSLEMYRRADRGFRLGGLRSRLGSFEAYVTPFFLDLLTGLEARVRSLSESESECLESIATGTRA